MGTHAPLPMTMTTVTNTADAITFLHGLEEACNTRGFGWWYKSAVGTTDEQTAAQRELDKATRLDQLMDQELQSAIASQHGVRLNMDDATDTPQATTEGEAPRTTTPSTRLNTRMLPHGTYGLKAIENWVQIIVSNALGDGATILEQAMTQPRPGKACLQVLRDVWAPVTTTTTSAARRALDDHFRSFTTESKLPAFFTRALKLAIVCRYYAPAEDWHKTVIDHTIESVNNAYGPDAKLTIAIERVPDAMLADKLAPNVGHEPTLALKPATGRTMSHAALRRTNCRHRESFSPVPSRPLRQLLRRRGPSRRVRGHATKALKRTPASASCWTSSEKYSGTRACRLPAVPPSVRSRDRSQTPSASPRTPFCLHAMPAPEPGFAKQLPLLQAPGLFNRSRKSTSTSSLCAAKSC